MCDSKGKTHESECLLKKAICAASYLGEFITKAYDGPCKKDSKYRMGVRWVGGGLKGLVREGMKGVISVCVVKLEGKS